MEKDSRIYVAGHRGMVGSGIMRELARKGYTNIVVRSSVEMDLRNQSVVADFFAEQKPEYVFLAAAKVGGIMANNTYRGEFLYDNLMIQSNVIHQAYLNKVKKLLFLGSSCIYPKLAPQPLKEKYLLSGYLEESNEPYAIAKIAGIKLCENYRIQYGCDFISAMPTNLYGPNDNYDQQKSHVVPALIGRFHAAKINGAKTVEVWGSGKPLREFMHVDDLSEASVFLMNNYSGLNFVNIGVGSDMSVRELAEKIKTIVGYTGEILFDSSKPDGTPRKLMDVTEMTKMGWRAKISIDEGLRAVYEDKFLKNQNLQNA